MDDIKTKLTFLLCEEMQDPEVLFCILSMRNIINDVISLTNIVINHFNMFILHWDVIVSTNMLVDMDSHFDKKIKELNQYNIQTVAHNLFFKSKNDTKHGCLVKRVLEFENCLARLFDEIKIAIRVANKKIIQEVLYKIIMLLNIYKNALNTV